MIFKDHIYPFAFGGSGSIFLDILVYSYPDPEYHTEQGNQNKLFSVVVAILFQLMVDCFSFKVSTVHFAGTLPGFT